MDMTEGREGTPMDGTGAQTRLTGPHLQRRSWRHLHPPAVVQKYMECMPRGLRWTAHNQMPWLRRMGQLSSW